jgi:predicted kinase
VLVLVGGAPASGKTTLAERLASALGFSVLHRDPISEALAEVLRPCSPDEQRKLIVPLSFAVFYRLLDEALDRGENLVAETNFAVGISEDELRPRLARTTAVLLHCSVPYALSVARFINRFQKGERHWCFFDEYWAEKLVAGESLDAWQHARPLELDIPSLAIETSDGYTPTLDTIVAFVRVRMLGGR